MSGPGTKYTTWRDSENPAKSVLTRIVSAALSVGFKLARSKGNFYRGIEKGTDRLRVCWLMRAMEVTFKPDFKEETISIDEFRRRFESDDWCNANWHHPIAYMRRYLEQTREVVEIVQKIGNGDFIQRSEGGLTTTIFIPAGSSQEEVDNVLEGLTEL
ncbi:MAG: hypothetical protein AB7I98_03885 [Verrucomicrobiales bacterium]